MMKRKNRIALSALVALALIAISLPAAYSQTGPSFAQQLPITPLNWFPIAMGGVLLIAAIAALVYMLSGLIGSSNAKTWSRMQVYEALVSIILIIAFGFFSYLFFISPQTAFTSIGLVPQTCTSANDIFTLATCDLSTFNTASFVMADYLYFVSFAAGLIPSLTVTIAPIPTQKGINASLTSQISPVPVNIETMFKVGFDAFLFMMVLNQLQLLILSGSLMFLSLFLTLGLIVRTFGVTRSFGGAMIAFGLGLGLVYPMLVSLTYGFIVTNSGLACIASPSLQCASGVAATGTTALINSIISFTTGGFGGSVGSFILTIGYIVAGFTFIPFLNFTILNAFIVDFSRAVGEQVDFMSLLSQFI